MKYEVISNGLWGDKIKPKFSVATLNKIKEEVSILEERRKKDRVFRIQTGSREREVELFNQTFREEVINNLNTRMTEQQALDYLDKLDEQTV